MTLTQLSGFNRALAILGLLEFQTQAAVVGVVKNISNVNTANGVYFLDGDSDVTNVVITDGIAAETYVEDTHYILDAKTGMVQFIDQPAGADADVVITYDTTEVLAADEVAEIGIANNTDNRGTLYIRGTNEVGPRSLVVLHDVQLRPDGEREYISEEDFVSVEIVGRVFRDDTQPAGKQLGYERDITE